MITTARARQAYVRVDRTRFAYSRPSRLPFAAAVLACLLLFLALFFLTGACEDTRGRFMERLGKEKELIEINKALKMELAAVSQRGYMEFAAQERLGLKKPDDKEVVVLR